MSAFDAEFGIDREYRAAIRASSRQRACAFLAELRLDTVIVLAGCALHRSLPKAAAKLMNMQPLREPPIFNVEAKRRIKPSTIYRHFRRYIAADLSVRLLFALSRSNDK